VLRKTFGPGKDEVVGIGEVHTGFWWEELKDHLEHLGVDGRIILNCMLLGVYVVGPCHHGMARPQVADRGTASDKEGSCE